MSTRERARPMAADQRRAAILAAARPVVLEHGRATTTRQVATAAGVAEGTLFRVFATKDELLEAVLEREVDPAPFFDALDAIDPGLPLEDRLVAGVALLRDRFHGIAALMSALGARRPPAGLEPDRLRPPAGRGLRALLEPDADRFRVPLDEVVQALRLLTFSASHPHFTHGDPWAPERIVRTVLHGVLRAEAQPEAGSGEASRC